MYVYVRVCVCVVDGGRGDGAVRKGRRWATEGGSMVRAARHVPMFLAPLMSVRLDTVRHELQIVSHALELNLEAAASILHILLFLTGRQ